MGQECLVYSFVARGTIVIAEHTIITIIPSNLPRVVAQCLEKLQADPHKRFTTKHDAHTFCFLVENGYVYSVVAAESAGQQILFKFLECIRQEFKNMYSQEKADAATELSLSNKFGPIMKHNMQWVVDHADEIDKVAKVKAQISEVQLIISDNVTKVVQRGGELDSVAQKAKELYNSSAEYQKIAIQVKRKMWYHNAKTKLIILGIVVLILGIILWVSICNGFNCSSS